MKNPKLTKDIRAQVVDSVIASTYIPAKKQAILDSAALAAREAVRALLPAGFERAIGTLPREWFGKVTEVYPSRHVNPRNILKGASGPMYLKIGEPVIIPRCVNVEGMIRDTVQKDDTHPSWGEILAVQIEAAHKVRKEEDEMRAELMDFLNSKQTYKQVVEAMPQLERHLPKPPAPALPLVVNPAPLQKRLAKAGFDLGAVTADLPQG